MPELPIEVVRCDDPIPGERVDAWAARRMAGVPSRAAARKLLRRGLLRVDGERVESSRHARMGASFELLAAADGPRFEVSLPVLHLAPGFAVVHKPAGLLTNGNRLRTVENALPVTLPPSDAWDALPRPRPVHRLDYETAGCLVVARTASALRVLSEAFAERQVHKRYRAIVLGDLAGVGAIAAPLDDRVALTRYRSLGAFRSLRTGWCTEVELEPVTGRMHQLRRHLAWLGHPVLGDRRYGTGPVYRGGGLFLAATAIRLVDPDTAAQVAVVARPPLKYASFRRREERRWQRVRASCDSEPSRRQDVARR